MINFNTLYKFYLQKNNCDLKLISEDKKDFDVHAIVIAVGIPKIRGTLLSPFDRVFKRRTYNVSGVKSKELELVIQYAYLHHCDLEEDASAALELLRASSRLRMIELQAHCFNVFQRNLNFATAITLMAPAEKTNSLVQLAVDEAEKYILRNLTEKNEDGNTKKNELALCSFRSLISDDRLHAPYEEMVVETVLQWVDHDRNSRHESLPQLLQLIRLGFVTSSCVDFLRGHKTVSENNRARAALQVSHGTVRSLRDGTRLKVNRLPLVLRPRIPHATILALGGFAQGDTEGATNVIEIYDHLAERWTVHPNLQLSTELTYHGAEIINNFLYVVGGLDSSGITNAGQRLNLRTLEWEPILHMTHSRCFVATATVNGLLYAFGGRERAQLSRRHVTCEVYDPATNIWSNVAPMSIARSDAGIAVLNGHIYLIGGFDGTEFRRDCERYKPETNQWESIAFLIEPRGGHRCAVYRGQIFAVGGNSGHERLKSVERYDPVSNTWSGLAEMHTTRSNFGMSVLYDQLIVSGGYDGKSVTKLVEIYDIMNDLWYPANPLITAKSAVVCHVVDDINFSQQVLGSTPRDDTSLLRDFSLERVHFNPNLAEQSLPRGTTSLRPPVFEPLPQPWLDVFLAEDDGEGEVDSDVDEDNESTFSDDSSEDSDDDSFDEEDTDSLESQ